MKYCLRCGWGARKKTEQSRFCPQCGTPTHAVLFNRILDGDNNILYEGLDKQEADIVWALAKHNHTLVKRIEYEYKGGQDEKPTPD